MAPPTRSFRHLLMWLFTGTRGGTNRGRIIEALREEPMNTNQLRIMLDLDYRTVRHHLEVLEDNDLITSTGNRYGKMYFVSQRLEESMDVFEEVWSQMREKQGDEEEER
jgi:DNA-binding transcriptional ArsR family regulator